MKIDFAKATESRIDTLLARAESNHARGQFKAEAANLARVATLLNAR